MNLNDIPWTLILFFVAQTASAIWYFSNLNATVNNIKSRVSELEKENDELKKQLREMRDIMIKVEHNTGLLMLGRIKTGSKEAA